VLATAAGVGAKGGGEDDALVAKGAERDSASVTGVDVKDSQARA
jgi:hypothetical protein